VTFCAVEILNCTLPDASVIARTSLPAAINGMHNYILPFANFEMSLTSCRDGVKKPSVTPRQREIGSRLGVDLSVKKKRQSLGNGSASGSKSSSFAEAASQHLSASLQRFEGLHERTGLDLRIPDGKRLKLHHDPLNYGFQPRSRMARPKELKLDLDICSPAPKHYDGMTGGTSLAEVPDSDEFPEPVLVRACIHGAGKSDESLASRPSVTLTKRTRTATGTLIPQVSMLEIQKFLTLQMTRRDRGISKRLLVSTIRTRILS